MPKKAEKKSANNEEERKVKVKRALNGYQKFIAEQYNSVRDLPSKDRFRVLAQRWKEHKAKKQGGEKKEAETDKPIEPKKVRKPRKKKAEKESLPRK
jgi:hypothetical protein